MTATEALERRIDELCRENERLRQQVASIIGRSFRTTDKMDCLERENAKLRELVRDMYESMDVSCQFGHAIPAGTMAHVKNRAIGLGIEVDNG